MLLRFDTFNGAVILGKSSTPSGGASWSSDHLDMYCCLILSLADGPKLGGGPWYPLGPVEYCGAGRRKAPALTRLPSREELNEVASAVW